MSSDTEKLLSHALKVFNDKLSDRQVIKLEGMEDYLKVPQYKALVNLEKKAAQMEVDALTQIMDSKIAYLKAAQELRACEKRWLDEIRNGMDSLDERDKLVKDVNMKMRKGDYSILQPAAPVVVPSPASPKVAAKSPIYKRPEAARPAAHPVPPKTGKPDVTDIKKRLAMMNLSIDSSRSPLQPMHTNKPVEITETPKPGPMLSSKGSLDGSLVHNRAPNTPLCPEKWDVPAPNFDDTIDAATPVNPLLRGAPHRPLPLALLKFPDENGEEEEKEEADDTFPLVRPSLPFQTPTVPNSRPFLLSSLRTDASKQQQQDHRGILHALPPRPIPTPVSSARPGTATAAADPLGALGLMKLKRPVLNSDVGKKLMGQL